MRDFPNCVWIGPIYEPTGYADEGRGLLFALEQAGVPVALRAKAALDADFSRGLPSAMREALARQESRALANPFVLVQHYLADGFVHAPTSAYNVGRTMFETDSLPPNWVAKCNRMDELWVPSTFNRESFRRAGVRVPIHVVRGGIDTDFFSPDVPPLPIPGLRGTVYLSVFEWRARKGWDVLLRAWAQAFSASDDVTLVLRTHANRIHANRDSSANAPVLPLERRIDAFLREECGRSLADVAPIVVLTDDLPVDAMPSLYRSAHAYVSPTRGEGWGRPFMEAMATGVPVIATRWSAHLDYMNDQNSFLIDTDGLTDADDPGMRLYDGHHWAAPRISDLVTHLRTVHDDRAGARMVGQRARRDMVDQWQWSCAAGEIAERLRAIGGQLQASRVSTRQVGSAWSDITGDVPRAVSFRVDANVFRADAPLGVELLLSALAERVGAAMELCLHHDTPQRPPLTLPAARLWECLRSAPSAVLPATTLTWLDRAHAIPVQAPLAGRWIVCTGDVVGARVPDAIASILRERADAVWVPHHAAYEACRAIGVSLDRLWVVPTGRLADAISPDATRYPRPRDVESLLLLPVLDDSDIAHAELVLRSWQRVASADSRSRLQLLVPTDAPPTLRSWGQALAARMAGGRLAPGLTAEVFITDVYDEMLPAVVRAADVVVVPEATAFNLWQVALACGRGLLIADSADAAPLRDAEAAWVVRKSANGTMAGAELLAALREACNVECAARRGRAARQYAEGLPTFREVADLMAARLSPQGWSPDAPVLPEAIP